MNHWDAHIYAELFGDSYASVDAFMACAYIYGPLIAIDLKSI